MDRINGLEFGEDGTYHEEVSLTPAEVDKKLLDKADQAWRELVAAMPPAEVEADFAAEVGHIVEAARRDLLA